WKIDVMGLLTIFVLLFIEGSFRHHRRSVTAHHESTKQALATAEKQYSQSLSVANEKCRSLSDQLTTMQQQSILQTQHSKSLDWGGEWKLAEDGFRCHFNCGVRAHRQFDSITNAY